MKLPGRDTTAAEAEAVTADIAALQADIERADTTLEVPSCRVLSAAYTGLVYAKLKGGASVCRVDWRSRLLAC